MSVVIVGQKKLINKIQEYNLDTFPRSLLISGIEGSGKHTLCNFISDYLCLELIDITDTISLDLIDEITLRAKPYIYFIDGSILSDKKENVLLKFIEEPLKNSFIIIICESTSQLLPTVVGRCQLWEMEIYTKDELKQFTNNDLILQVAKTPGEVKKFENQDIEAIINLCNTIVDRIGNANYANTLTISDKIAFDNEVDKFDFRCFVRCLQDTLADRALKADGKDFHKFSLAFFTTSDLYRMSYIKNINKKNLLDSYLTTIKGYLR